jgi:hypothetical protein
MNRDLFKKLIDEQPLTAEETLRLDGALEGEGSKMARHAVSALDDDAPSMTWRSSLNQRLAQVSRKRRTAVYWRFGVAASAVAAASVLVVSFFQPYRPETVKSPQIAERPELSVEEAILTEHEYQMGQASVGVQVSFNEAGS